jgi:hypothetical protein
MNETRKQSHSLGWGLSLLFKPEYTLHILDLSSWPGYILCTKKKERFKNAYYCFFIRYVYRVEIYVTMGWGYAPVEVWQLKCPLSISIRHISEYGGGGGGQWLATNRESWRTRVLLPLWHHKSHTDCLRSQSGTPRYKKDECNCLCYGAATNLS